jgi:hypothetical protein
VVATLPVLTPASLDMGDGGPHDPQIRFTADYDSCRWNGFPVCIDVELASSYVPFSITPTRQLIPFTTTPGGGGTVPTEAQWPHTFIADYLEAILAGYFLTYHYKFLATAAGTSVGSAGVLAIGDGLCTGSAVPGAILGFFDSGVIGGTGACEGCSGISDPYEVAMNFTNFNPASGSVTISDGQLEMAWVTGGTPAHYRPNQEYGIVYKGPCEVDSGLYISLETDECGNLTKTYTQIGTDVNNLGLGITATILGGHGSDLAKPDPSCGGPDYCCDLAGATCSGAADN